MRATIKIAIIRNSLLEEDKKNVVFETDRTFIGPLFFEKDDMDEVVEVIEEKTVDAPVLDILLTAYDMMKRNDRIASDDSTLRTMMHWQYMNSFSDDSLSEAYGFDNDTDLLKSMGVKNV